VVKHRANHLAGDEKNAHAPVNGGEQKHKCNQRAPGPKQHILRKHHRAAGGNGDAAQPEHIVKQCQRHSQKAAAQKINGLIGQVYSHSAPLTEQPGK